jgi:small subunit ribosomal protein S3Ae
MVSFVNDYTTKDGYVIRAYLVVFSQGRINSSRKHAIRLISKSLLTDKASSMTYEQFAQQAVLGQLASEIYNQIKKISHLKHVGIRKTKVLRVGEPMKEESPPQEETTQDVAAA